VPRVNRTLTEEPLWRGQQRQRPTSQQEDDVEYDGKSCLALLGSAHLFADDGVDQPRDVAVFLNPVAHLHQATDALVQIDHGRL
jgi:hypothetical protein